MKPPWKRFGRNWICKNCVTEEKKKNKESENVVPVKKSKQDQCKRKPLQSRNIWVKNIVCVFSSKLRLCYSYKEEAIIQRYWFRITLISIAGLFTFYQGWTMVGIAFIKQQHTTTMLSTNANSYQKSGNAPVRERETYGVLLFFSAIRKIKFLSDRDEILFCRSRSRDIKTSA